LKDISKKSTITTALVALATCCFVIIIDWVFFPQFQKINFFNLILEFLISLFVLALLFSLQKYKNNQFYFSLNIGFFLLFLSYFVDAIDQIFIHSIVFTVIFEKATLVCAAVFIYLGSKQWMKSFEELSLTDYLTQIPNRKLMSQMVNSEISKCIQESSVLSIAIIDIDYFKKINDEFGHSAGDAILKSFAKYLSKSIHKNFNVGRWGGEEFIVLMKHTNIDQAKEIMDELRINTSKESFSHGNINQSFTISIGISQWYDDTDDFESLFIKADKALYRAKKAGRNTVEY